MHFAAGLQRATAAADGADLIQTPPVDPPMAADGAAVASSVLDDVARHRRGIYRQGPHDIRDHSLKGVVELQLGHRQH